MRKQSCIEQAARGPLATVVSQGASSKYLEKSKRRASKGKGKQITEAIKEVTYTYHKMTLNELSTEFATSCTHGLTDQQATAALAKYGLNVLKPPETHRIRKILGYMFGGFCWLLWIGSLICFLAWKPIGEPNPDPTNLGLAILLLIVIGLQAAFEAFQDWSSSKVMNSIKGMMAADATVIRNGVETRVPADRIVPGDLVLLTYGQKVPADLRIIESADLRFDRSMLTGESEAVEGAVNSTDDNYTESKNVAFMATMVTNGTGKGIITQTGSNTMIGSIAVLTSSAKQEATTLQKEINQFVILIAILAISTVTICFIVWGAWIYQSYPTFINVSAMLVNAIAILVAFIPTGLPVAVTLSLLLVARKMARNKVLVKNLTVIETLSCCNVIASDKTGTLTQNKMFVINSCAGLTQINSQTARRASVLGTGKRDEFTSSLQLLNSCLLCNEAKFDESNPTEKEKPVNERAASGGATDIAILRYGANYMELSEVEKNYKCLDKEIGVCPFNSKNKWMARVLKAQPSLSRDMDCFNLDEDECVIMMKGAPDILMKSCKWIVNDDGTHSPLDERAIERLRAIQNEWCMLGQRVLLICKKVESESKLTTAGFSSSPAGFETYLKSLNDLCVLGMVGIIDKPRDGIENIIRMCRQAGVRIFMVTGDFHITAAAIASQIGIFSSSNKYDTIETIKEMRIQRRMSRMSNFNLDASVTMDMKPKYQIDNDDDDDDEYKPKIPLYKRIISHLPCFKHKITAPFVADPNYRSLLLTGADLEQLNETGDWSVITKYEEIVFARTTPSQKLKVVEEFKKRRNIVAVTGDGVNDSPALKAANIGIAMGGGSEVAMEAAQVVLLDNSFNSMLVAIENGRLVFENLRKVVLYLLPAGSFAEVVPIILNIYLGVPLPLSAFQMICICVLTDMGPSLAMMLEKSEGDILEKPPRVVGRDHLVDKKLLLYAYFFLGVFESAFSIVMYFLYLGVYGKFSPSQIFLAYDKWSDGYCGRTQSELQNFQNVAQTVTFATLVIVQTFGNVYITRTHKFSLIQSLPVLKAHRNLWLFLAQFSSIALLLIIIYVPFFNTVFKTAPIPVEFYFIPIGFCLIFIAVDELRKMFFRRGINPCASTAW